MTPTMNYDSYNNPCYFQGYFDFFPEEHAIFTSL